MRKLVIFLFVAMILTACGSVADGPVLVEIISLDHAPIRPTAAEALAAATTYGDKVTVLTYNFDTPEGAAFAEEKGLTEHTPIAIFVNGEMSFEVNGRSVTFFSFPQGEGTGMVAEGTWTMADLRAVLDKETN
jgi:hypothetical protein